MPPVAARKARFSGFELDLETGELFRERKRIPIQDQPFQVLRMLVENPGALVTRDQLRQELWPADTFVDFDHGLNKAVGKLREALSSAGIELVETLPRRGYRFTGDVELVEQPVSKKEEAVTAKSPTSSSRRPWILSAVIVALLIVFGLTVGRVKGWFGPARAAMIRSIAVLPLQNLSGDPAQEYFSDGMTDALITDLAQSGSLKVISRTSTIQYKKTTKPLPQIARELGVDAVVEGSVTRDGDRVRITAQLVDAPNDRHLWARSYERQLSGVLILQDEIARDISEEIRVKLGETQPPRLEVDPVAYNEYLLGRYFWNKRNEAANDAAITHFENALKRDPRYARAYAGLADAHLLAPALSEGRPTKGSYLKARAAAQRALELESSLAEPHATLGRIYWTVDWDFAGSEREFQLALRLDPNYATAHQWRAQIMIQRGRIADAQAEAQRALELDPLSLIVNNTMAEVLVGARHYDQAIAQYRKTLTMDPAFLPARVDLIDVYRAMGKHDLALREFRAVCDQFHIYIFCADVRKAEQVFAAGGAKGIARLVIQENLRAAARGKPVDAWEAATCYVELGDFDRAFVWLNKAIEQHDSQALDIKASPLLDPLRKDPRFPVLVNKVGLPD
jgi:TolB-like protein/DNA-binding winged helix-turn-helix (wHTH) protein